LSFTGREGDQLPEPATVGKKLTPLFRAIQERLGLRLRHGVRIMKVPEKRKEGRRRETFVPPPRKRVEPPCESHICHGQASVLEKE